MSHLNELLSAYLDGETTPEEQARVVGHLAECGDCRDEMAALDAARSSLRSLPLLEPSVSLWPERVSEVTDRRRPIRLTRAWAWAAAVAAALLIAVGVTAGLRQGPTRLDIDSVAERHTARAVVDPGLPVVQVVSVVSGQ
ncbi:MAG: anti-sigma factor family protein [Acidimicrobiia bacterium]